MECIVVIDVGDALVDGNGGHDLRVPKIEGLQEQSNRLMSLI